MVNACSIHACTTALTLKLMQVSEAAEQTALEICAAEHTTETVMQVLGTICVASIQSSVICAANRTHA